MVVCCGGAGGDVVKWRLDGVWCSAVRRGVVGCGGEQVKCGVMGCSVVWCGVVWCGVVL